MPALAVSTTTYYFTKAAKAKYDTTGKVTFTTDHAAADWYHADWLYRQKITVNHEQVAGIGPGAHDEGRQLAEELNTQFGLDLPAGERPTKADMLFILGYDWEE